MKKVFALIWLFVTTNALVAQNSETLFAPFAGGTGDGYSNAMCTTGFSEPTMFLGGNDDGSVSAFISTNPSPVGLFHGGANDGYALAFLQSGSISVIWNGGFEDGYASVFFSNEPSLNSAMFGGGTDDGYDMAFKLIQEIEYFCLGDFDYDGVIATGDLLIFLGNYGCFEACNTDLDADGNVSTNDLLIFLSLFGTSCIVLF